ncbi:MAG TPA: prepilin-type N-terminal cleavage/methylation domain-containing protein [Ramlibacter sp.]|jgi:general secretion pathway protein J|nr:prepilin-type N-terminal cleavage/methylation domain-containing protein [Ramlibacter sp.]
MKRRASGFTLVELLVSLFALAVLAGLSWRGLDGMMRARQATEARADDVLTLQTGLAQWAADLDAIIELAPSPALEWNGRVLRLTRRSSLSAGEGVHVVGWTQREGRWLRWESPAVVTRGELDAAWQQADLWARTPSDAMRRQEVAIAPLQEWQVFYFRNDAWTNPQSSDAGEPRAGRVGSPGAARAPASTLPEGVRLVLQLPPGRAITGRLQRDWVRGVVGGNRAS